MISHHPEDKRLDDLSIQLAKFVDGWGNMDVAKVCAGIAAFAVGSSYSNKDERAKCLDMLFHFMTAVANDVKFMTQLTHYQRAQQLIDELCQDPEVWATHGRPGDKKLAIIKHKITEALAAAVIASRYP